MSTGFLSDRGSLSGDCPAALSPASPRPPAGHATEHPVPPAEPRNAVSAHAPVLHVGGSTAAQNTGTHISETKRKSKAGESDFLLTFRSREVSILENTIQTLKPEFFHDAS